MRIAEVATVATPVAPEGSGSIESVVWTLSQELTGRGHEVTVFGVGESQGPGEVVVTLPGPYGAPGVPEDWRVAEFVHVARALEQAGRFDLVHAHGYLYGLPLAALCPTPMVHTLHVMPSPESIELARLYPTAVLTALSAHQWAAVSDVRPAAVIPHAVDTEVLTPRLDPDDYVAYLGRFMPGKGVTLAIECARALGIPLRLAGWANDYFHSEVEPLVDGQAVQYVGAVSGPTRDEFLGGARALLYPIRAPEPFGLVLAEAMACGTPVAAFRLGAVGEIVDEGVTGCTVRAGGDLTEALRAALSLDRSLVADRARQRFAPTAMAAAYEGVFDLAASEARELSNCATT